MDTAPQKKIIVKSVSKTFDSGRNDRSLLLRIIGLFQKQSPRKEICSVQNVSLEIEEGEVVGIIGKNGSGKSTLLRLISGIYQPDHGEIVIKGNLMYINGFNHGTKPRLTMRENIFLVGSIMGLTNEDVRSVFEEIVDFSGLKDFLDMKVYQFSSGMVTRLNFSIFIHFASKKSLDIIILDEVLSAGGDIEFHEKAGSKMKELIRGGATILLASHNLEYVTSYCEKTLWIENGRIKEEGSAAEIVKKYRASVKRKA